VYPDFVRISRCTENIERTAASSLASGADTPDQRPLENFTRSLSIGAATVTILAAGADTFGLQSEDDRHSLPTQKTEDLF
jgi:hypothetical protein